MKLNKKLFGSLLLSGELVLGACGTDGKESQGGDSDEPIEVTMWHAMNGPHQESLTELTDEFNASQDKYKVIEENQGDYNSLNQSIIARSEEHTSELQSRFDIVCRLLLEN